MVKKLKRQGKVTVHDFPDFGTNGNGFPAWLKRNDRRLLQPAVNRTRFKLSRKPLQQEFLDHGVLALLKNWLEPLPDGSLPNINVRAAVLEILTDLPIDLEQYDRKVQLRKSGIEKAILFFLKYDEETTSNRKLAKELMDKWSRPIFNKSTRFEDMKNIDDEMYRGPPPARRAVSNASGRASWDDDLDLSRITQARESGQPSSSRQHVSRPEAMSMHGFCSAPSVQG